MLHSVCMNAKNQQAAGKEGAIGAVVAVLRQLRVSDWVLQVGCVALHSMCMNA